MSTGPAVHAGGAREPAPVHRRAAVLGSPVAHSLSPALHRAAYQVLGLPWEYGWAEVDEAGLPAFVAGLDATWAGLSLTMPLKRAVLPLVDRTGPTAQAVGAVNTVVVRADGGLTGENTDVPGLVAAVRERAPGWSPRGVTVLGGGATAASTVAAAASLTSGPVAVHLRDVRRGGDLPDVAQRFGVELALRRWDELGGATRSGAGLAADLVVSTAPAGAADPLVPLVPDRPGLLFDVVYAPWPTALATAWEARGGRVLSGLDLLVHQAVLQVELMTGRPGPLAAMRDAGVRALADRA